MPETRIIDHLGQPIKVLTTPGVYEVVIDALDNRKPLSIVRMSDGEMKILDYCKRNPASAPMREFNPEWRVKFGVEGITCGEMEWRLNFAANNCTYFAPDGGEEFFLKHWPKREPFAEIYFPHRLSRKQRINILEAAGSFSVVNRYSSVAQAIMDSPHCPLTALQKLHTSFGYLPDWTHAQRVVDFLAADEAPLVLVSAGPGSKYIIPKIAEQGKVVLDMGSGVPHFWCTRDNPHPPCRGCRAVAKEE